jgi:hypothetical protein
MLDRCRPRFRSWESGERELIEILREYHRSCSEQSISIPRKASLESPLVRELNSPYENWDTGVGRKHCDPH